MGQKLEENETDVGKSWLKAVKEFDFKEFDPPTMEPV
jgi:hypothetical protein